MVMIEQQPEHVEVKQGMPDEQTGQLPDGSYLTIYKNKDSGLPIIPIRLFDMGIPKEEKWHVLSLGTSNAWVLTGLRGNGKSLTLAFLIAKAMSCNMNVWSNMTVRFMLQHEDGLLELKETRPLDWDLLYAMDKGLQGGAVAIDEIQYFGDSRRSGSIKNQLLNAVIMQMRHRTLDFYYTVKNIGWIDNRLRYETDIEINCEDYYNITPEAKKGMYIQWKIRDLSGTWTGEPYAETLQNNSFSEYRYGHMEQVGKELQYCAALWWMWHCYSTEEIISLEDAFGGVQLNLTKRVVGVQKATTEQVYDAINCFKDAGQNEVTKAEFRNCLSQVIGREVSQREITPLMSKLGVTEGRKHAGPVFYKLS